MSRLQLPHEKKSLHPVRLKFCFVLTVFPSLGIALVHLPFGEDHIGLLLGSVLAAVFIYWSVNNILSGVYTSIQNTYRRSQAPIRYWIHTLIVAIGTVLSIFGWLYQAYTMIQKTTDNG